MDATQNRIATGMRVSSAAGQRGVLVESRPRCGRGQQGAQRRAGRAGPRRRDGGHECTPPSTRPWTSVSRDQGQSSSPRVLPASIAAEIQSEISEPSQSQLRNTADSAGVQRGELAVLRLRARRATNATKTIVAAFSSGPAAPFRVDTVSVDLTQIELYDDADQTGILDRAMVQSDGAGGTVAVSTGVSVANLDISALTDNAAGPRGDGGADRRRRLRARPDHGRGHQTSGAIKNRIGLQQDFVKALMDSIDRGVGQLVDADMNAESDPPPRRLQTQQQLGHPGAFPRSRTKTRTARTSLSLIPLIARTDPVSGPPGPAPSWSGVLFRRAPQPPFPKSLLTSLPMARKRYTLWEDEAQANHPTYQPRPAI